MKKIVFAIFTGIISFLVGVEVTKKLGTEECKRWKSMSDKHLDLFLLMNQWVKIKQEGKDFTEYFKENNYKKIAVYGVSYVGETLIEELKKSDVQIQYAIDKEAGRVYADINIVSIDDSLEEVDAVVVTAISFFDEIEKELSAKVKCPIISLEDIVFEM